jgi:hypothetical protein
LVLLLLLLLVLLLLRLLLLLLLLFLLLLHGGVWIRWCSVLIGDCSGPAGQTRMSIVPTVSCHTMSCHT